MIARVLVIALMVIATIAGVVFALQGNLLLGLVNVATVGLLGWKILREEGRFVGKLLERDGISVENGELKFPSRL